MGFKTLYSRGALGGAGRDLARRRLVARGGILRNVVYLHGFASSPGGRKIALLQELLEPEGFRLLAPDLNIPSFEKLDFKAMVKISAWEIRRQLPVVVVGSSLGAVVALDVERRGLHAPLVLVAPALGFGDRWLEKLPDGDPVPFFHHGEARELAIHRRFFEEMSRVDVDGEPPRVPVTIVMGRKDESVPFELVRGVWERWEKSGHLRPESRFLAIENGDHGLVEHADTIAEEIRAAARLRV